jgi:predicted metal-binding membrane protein
MAALTVLGYVLERQRRLISISLVAVIVLSWVYLVKGAGTMQEMGGMVMPMSIWPWTFVHAALMFIMWFVMMMAMMLPSATPAILLYSHICSRRNATTSIAPMLFTSGYLGVWACFSLIAVLGQFLLEWAGLLSSMMEMTSTALSGALLIAIGLYQMTPFKRACLHVCRSPLDFMMRHWHGGATGAFRMGVWHGAYCVACCWALMLLLFIGGVMSLAWIAGIAVYIFVEKLVPGGRAIAWTGGVLLIGAGTFLVLR